MSKLGDLLRARSAVTRAVNRVTDRPATPARYFNPRLAVRNSPDLERVLALPRRTPAPDAEFVAAVTARYLLPGATGALRPVQAVCLDEATRIGGLFGQVAVGEGKTLISLLLPTALKAYTSVILVPAQLRDQLLSRDIPRLSQIWDTHTTAGQLTSAPQTEPVLHVYAYSDLSSRSKGDFLDVIKPDLIVCDEAHSLAHGTAARTKRFKRYLRENPNTRLCMLSGTMCGDDFAPFAQLLVTTLGRNAPAPIDWSAREEWAAALNPSAFPAAPGALTRLCEPGESVRAGYRRRFVSTPGVVASEASQLGTSLVIQDRLVTVPPAAAAALTTLRDSWTTPDGVLVDDALTLSRYARQLAAGLYYRQTWPDDVPQAQRDAWLDARSAWASEVRSFLARSARAGLDSPGLLAQAAADGTWRSTTWSKWAGIRDVVTPTQEAVWVDPFLVEDVKRWGAANPRSCIWYVHDAFGARLAGETGWPLIAGGDGDFMRLQTCLRSPPSVPLILSVKARGTGTDGLQAVYADQLVITPSSSGKTWEQLLGRLHRPGQRAPAVTTTVYTYTPELLKAVATARSNAAFLQETVAGRQKLMYADFTFTTTPS